MFKNLEEMIRSNLSTGYDPTSIDISSAPQHNRNCLAINIAGNTYEVKGNTIGLVGHDATDIYELDEKFDDLKKACKELSASLLDEYGACIDFMRKGKGRAVFFIDPKPGMSKPGMSTGRLNAFAEVEMDLNDECSSLMVTITKAIGLFIAEHFNKDFLDPADAPTAEEVLSDVVVEPKAEKAGKADTQAKAKKGKSDAS